MLNADLAAGSDVVIVVSCFALEATHGVGKGDFATTRAAPIAELQALRNGASTVTVIIPNEAFLTLTGHGAGMMDGNLAPAAFRIGHAQACEEAETTRAAWNS